MGKPSYSALLVKAQEAGARRDYSEAESILMRIVSETDTVPEAWLYLGRARHALGDYERALSSFSSFLEYRPDDGSGWFYTGRSYLSIGRAREAATCLRSCIDKGRAGAEPWALLGFAELRLKRSAKAVEALERAVGLAPSDARIFRAYLNALYVHAIRTMSRGDPASAIGMLAFVIANGLDGSAQRLYKARALRSQGRLKEAIEDIEEAIRYSPDDASLRLHAATLRFAAGDAQGAMSEIERSGVPAESREGSPWTADAIDRYRVLVALQAGDHRTALKAALDRIRNGESDAAIRAVAAQANYELGRFDRAAAHFKRAVEADPASPELRIGLAQSLWELGDYVGARSAAKAASSRGAKREDCQYIELLCDLKAGADAAALLPKVQALLKSRPGEPRLMMALGECLYRTGRPDLADAWFSDVLRLWPDDDLALLYRISVAESLGREEEARDRCSEYLAVFPDNSAIRKDYVDLLVRSESWEAAAAAIEDGYAYSGSRGYDGVLAVCLRNSGRYREAAALYRGLLRADPKNPELLLGLSYSLYKSGAKSIAVDLLERGAAYIGKNAEPYLALGVLRSRQGEAEKAAAAFLRASELAPADPRPLRNLAKLYDKAGVPDTARHFEERALALDPDGRRSKRIKNG
ncbi:MAG: tetratricopeptide repeat protein [Spirochaetes bacterium]|nr:tetratricopeptide repeat protein [Spirochaetota bacterium]MBU1080631.1 tetratricopeptide repeat protein [Spirochaetota bacterium]